MLAEAMGDDFELVAFKLMQKEGLIKLLHSGTKILADVAFNAIVGIINNVCSTKVVQNLATHLIESKSPIVHAKAGIFLYSIISLYPTE